MSPRSRSFRTPASARLLGTGVLWALSTALSTLPAQDTGHLPASPKVLLEALPRTVENWTLRESRGGSDLGAVWLESFALRRFELFAPSGAADTPARARVTLSVLDTAAHPGSEVESFADFAPGKTAGENWLFLHIDGRPALVSPAAGGMPEEMRVLVADRFLVTLRLEGVLAGRMRFWFNQVDFKRLEMIPRGPLVPLPAGFSAVIFDELSGKEIPDRGVAVGKSLTGEGITDPAPESGDPPAR